MKRSIIVVFLVLSISLAGCNSILGPDNEPTSRTVTPVGVPTDNPTPTPIPQLAPGLTKHGVVDQFALGEAHASVLNGTSFTHHYETTVRSANGTIEYQTKSSVRVTANRSRYDVKLYVLGFNQTSGYSTEQWSNGTRVIMAQRSAENTSYRIVRGLDGEPISSNFGNQGILRSNPASSQSVYRLFSGVETRVVGKTHQNGSTLYEVAATNVTNPTTFALAGTTERRNFSFRALVTPAGLVKESRVGYNTTLNGSSVPTSLTGKTVTVSRTVRYSHLENTTIGRPAWYENALGNISSDEPSRSVES